MKDLIIVALNEALIILNKRVPQTKKKTISFDIYQNDITPFNVGKFMEDNEIPNNAYFEGVNNAYDAYESFALCYDIDVPTTDKDQLKYKQKQFSTIAFKSVYDLLLSNGYKRVGCNSGLFKEFDNTTVYDMFISDDFDRLVKYYSLTFSKIN